MESTHGIKETYVQNYVKIKNSDGKNVPLKERTETIAGYLGKILWSNPDENEVNTNVIVDNNSAEEECFTMPELRTAIKRAKNHGVS